MERAAADIFVGWLNARLGSAFSLLSSDERLEVTDGERRLGVQVFPLYDPAADPAWTRRCLTVAEELAKLLSVPFTLWIPPETDLPVGDRSDFLQRVAGAATTLSAGERGQVEFPVTLALKKQSDEASYVHVLGGLAPHWARLTGRAYGQYVLDATAIHRLPEPEQRVADLLEWVALTGNGMKSGAITEIQAEDAWTVNRPSAATGVTLIGASPAQDPANGTSVRRSLRAALKSAGERPAVDGVARAVVLVGVFRTMAEENATIALRSCDPAIYSGFDIVCLVADGACKALASPRPDALGALS